MWNTKEGLRLFREMKESVQNEILRLVPAIGADAFRKEEEKAEVVKHAIEIGGGEEETAPRACPLGQNRKKRTMFLRFW